MQRADCPRRPNSFTSLELDAPIGRPGADGAVLFFPRGPHDARGLSRGTGAVYVASNGTSLVVARRRDWINASRRACRPVWGKAALFYGPPSRSPPPEEPPGHLLRSSGSGHFKPRPEMLIVSTYRAWRQGSLAARMTESGVHVHGADQIDCRTEVADVNGDMTLREDLIAAGVQLYEFKPC